jgi:hypothetical protein
MSPASSSSAALHRRLVRRADAAWDAVQRALAGQLAVPKPFLREPLPWDLAVEVGDALARAASALSRTIPYEPFDCFAPGAEVLPCDAFIALLKARASLEVYAGRHLSPPARQGR